MCNINKGKGAIAIGLMLALLCSHSFAEKEISETEGQAEESKPEEIQYPEIKLSRLGHIDVNAKQRVLSWQVSDPNGLSNVDARIVKVEEGSMISKELYRSDKAEGNIELAELEQGPGLYALLVKAENKDKEVIAAGLRLSYSEVNKDCPTEKAWWPEIDPRQKSGLGENAKEETFNPDQSNLLSLSRGAKYIVTASVRNFIACPTEDGHLFTYVQFTNVETLQKEGGDQAEDAPRELVLRMPGGMAHGRVETVSDAPIFRKDERVMLFLTRDPQQQVAIVNVANGVLLLQDDKTVSAYSGAPVVGVGKDFSLSLDPAFKPNPKFARHWDPNMRAVWVEPEKSEPIGKSQAEEPKAGDPISLEEFSRYLEKAWTAADKYGRLPVELDDSPRQPYGETPVNTVKGG